MTEHPLLTAYLLQTSTLSAPDSLDRSRFASNATSN